MRRYALLLRGVNVGKNNSLPMAELRGMLEAAGCREVQTYVQSGNAVFSTSAELAAITAQIEAALAAYMGRPIGTTWRSAEQLRQIVAANPFPEAVGVPTSLCVTFLSLAPTEAELAPLVRQDFGPERFAVRGQEIFSFHPRGQGRSPLTAALGKLRVSGTLTTRNWNTVQRLDELANAPVKGRS